MGVLDFERRNQIWDTDVETNARMAAAIERNLASAADRLTADRNAGSQMVYERLPQHLQDRGEMPLTLGTRERVPGTIKVEDGGLREHLGSSADFRKGSLELTQRIEGVGRGVLSAAA